MPCANSELKIVLTSSPNRSVRRLGIVPPSCTSRRRTSGFSTDCGVGVGGPGLAGPALNGATTRHGTPAIGGPGCCTGTSGASVGTGSGGGEDGASACRCQGTPAIGICGGGGRKGNCGGVAVTTPGLNVGRIGAHGAAMGMVMPIVHFGRRRPNYHMMPRRVF